MLTSADVAAVPLFAGLPAAELERLARTSADLHLGPGEFAVPEGGARPLFAILTGKIDEGQRRRRPALAARYGPPGLARGSRGATGVA